MKMKQDFEHIYNVAVGLEEAIFPETRDRALETSCDLLFEKIYAARERLARHNGRNMGCESADVLAIVETYERMMRVLSRYFYFSGYRKRAWERRRLEERRHSAGD